MGDFVYAMALGLIYDALKIGAMLLDFLRDFGRVVIVFFGRVTRLSRFFALLLLCMAFGSEDFFDTSLRLAALFSILMPSSGTVL